MLVLSRKRGESIIVGDDIEIRVLEVHGSQVKIGIQAPARHTVHRKEVYLAIHGKDEHGGTPRQADAPRAGKANAGRRRRRQVEAD